MSRMCDFLCNRYSFVGATMAALMSFARAADQIAPVDGPWMARYWVYLVGVGALGIALLVLIHNVIKAYDWLKDEIRVTITDTVGTRLDTHERDERGFQQLTQDSLSKVNAKLDAVDSRLSRLEGRFEGHKDG